MKRKIASLILFLIMCGVAFGVPSKIMLQGRLVDENGVPIANRAITSAKLYVGTAQVPGDIGINVQTASDGFFSKVVELGSAYLGTFKSSQITGFKVLVGSTVYPSGDPFSVTSVPYALSADYVGGMTTQELSTSIINSTQTIVNNSTVWQQGTNKIYYNNGAVGIGTSEPSAKLEVVGSNAIKGTYSGDKSVFGILGDPSNVAVQGFNQNVSLGSYDFNLNDNNFELAQQYKSLVGVYGQAGANDVGMLGIKFRSSSGLSLGSAGVYGKSTTGKGGQFESDSGYGVYSSAPKNYFSGNVGIGKQNPGRALDVNGGIRVSSAGLGAEISGGVSVEGDVYVSGKIKTTKRTRTISNWGQANLYHIDYPAIGIPYHTYYYEYKAEVSANCPIVAVSINSTPSFQVSTSSMKYVYKTSVVVNNSFIDDDSIVLFGGKMGTVDYAGKKVVFDFGSEAPASGTKIQFIVIN